MSINIGIIGLGSLGSRRFELFQEIQEVDNIVFFDPSTKFFRGTKSVPNVDSIFSDKNIDAIVICSPNAPKRNLIAQAFDSKKHIFCEKPPAISLTDTLIIKSLHQSNPDVKIKFGFNHRYLSHYRFMKETINCGKYGKPLWVRGVYGKGFDKSFFNGFTIK